MRSWFKSIRVVLGLLLLGFFGIGLEVLSYYPREVWPAAIVSGAISVSLDVLNFLLGIV